MRLVVIFILTFILAQDCFGQSVDSLALKFKAQLLTTSRYGLANSDSLLSDITDQRVTFLSSPSSNTILLKVVFDQKYFTGDVEDQILWLGDCSYYLAFNIKRNTFYRLGGFDELDIDEFFDDFETVDHNLVNIEYAKTSEIDFYCLKEYAETSSKKRLNKSLCIPCCSEKLETTLVIPQKEN